MVELSCFDRDVFLHLDTGGSGIFKLIELFDGEIDVGKKLVCHIPAEAMPNNDTHHHNLLDVLGHCVCGYHPSLLGEFVLKVEESPLVVFLNLRLYKPCE